VVLISYIGTHALFIALQRVFQVDSNAELATLIRIPTSTISVWIFRNILPVELMIQLDLVLGIDTGALCYQEINKIPDEWILPSRTRLNKKVTPLKGQRLINVLLNEFHCDNHHQLAIKMGVDKNAINTWLERGIVPHHKLFTLHALRVVDLKKIYKLNEMEQSKLALIMS
jgi:hypothetical protein